MHAFPRRIAAALCAWLCLSLGLAHGAKMSPDPTGMWYDPANPGWGLSVTQQGETTFAVLFIYDANHQPVWFVASNIADSGAQLDPIGSELYTGTLYRTKGSWLGNASFDPSSFSIKGVGFLSIARGFTPGTLLVSYMIDGMPTTMIATTLQPQIWASIAPRLVGGYAGGIYLGNSACTFNDFNGRFGFGITQGAAPNRFVLSWGTGTDTGCLLDGTFTQTGQTGTLSGPFACGPIGSELPGSTMTLSDLVVGPRGISALVTLQNSQCAFSGNAGGALAPATPRIAGSMQPDPTGIWFDPLAPGYGLSLTQQGNNIFAALFTYGTDNNPQWLVASNVVDTGTAVFVPIEGLNGIEAEVFGGTLYRTSGATAGASNDTTPFTLGNVGTLQVRYGPGSPPFGSVLILTYTVDGVTASRTVQRQTWSGDSLAGSYKGGLILTSSTTAGCDAAANAGNNIVLTVSQSPTSTQIAWNPDANTQCSVSGSFAALGNYATFSGSGQCTSNTTPAMLDTFSITEMSVTAHAFSGTLSYASRPALLGGTCTYTGTIGGARRLP